VKQKLDPATALLLTIPPLLWASNAIVGRMLRDAVPPLTLNLLRWAIALLILLPLAAPTLIRNRAALATHWRRFAVLGLLGVGLYNSLQYQALQTSSPINVTLVAAGMPVWMLLVGRLFFHVPVRPAQVAGSVLSVLGVLLVLCRGEWSVLQELRLVPGDLLMVIATIVWSFYTWLSTQPRDPPAIRSDWAAFLGVQVFYGVIWSGLLAAGEWQFSDARLAWSWPVAAAMVYIAVGPAVIAFRCWGAGVQRSSPSMGAFFSNLTPLFAALFSSAILGEPPHAYHALAFVLIAGGIAWSARQ
jgi:drug/metabolite transporter (DMT)-like permease